MRRHIRGYLLPAYLRDDTKAMILGPDGHYRRVHEARAGTTDAQQMMMSRG
jgi:hypothetical protein